METWEEAKLTSAFLLSEALKSSVPPLPTAPSRLGAGDAQPLLFLPWGWNLQQSQASEVREQLHVLPL